MVKDAFGQLHADEALKNSTKAYIYQKTNGYRGRRAPAARRLAAVMACFLLAVFGWKGYSDFFTSVSTISIDVNPSFELDINRFDRVISVHAYNDDGAAVLASGDVRFLDYRTALEKLLQNERMEPYMQDGQPVEVTVFGDSDQKSSELLENVNACTASRGNVQCSVGNSEEAAKAHALGLSYGKYRAFLELQALDPSVTADDVQGLTMRQIRDLIRARSESPDAPDTPPRESKTDGESKENDTKQTVESQAGTGSTTGSGSQTGNGAGNGNGNGNGPGNGNGNGSGNGNGNGNGNGPGNGSGSGNGNGNGNGSGSGNGPGNGNGNGHGMGHGNGSGNGNGHGHGGGR